MSEYEYRNLLVTEGLCEQEFAGRSFEDLFRGHGTLYDVYRYMDNSAVESRDPIVFYVFYSSRYDIFDSMEAREDKQIRGSFLISYLDDYFSTIDLKRYYGKDVRNPASIGDCLVSKEELCEEALGDFVNLLKWGLSDTFNVAVDDKILREIGLLFRSKAFSDKFYKGPLKLTRVYESNYWRPYEKIYKPYPYYE